MASFVEEVAVEEIVSEAPLPPIKGEAEAEREPGLSLGAVTKAVRSNKTFFRARGS